MLGQGHSFLRAFFPFFRFAGALAAPVSLAGCLVEGTGSKTLDAVASATMAGAVTAADEIARRRAAKDAEDTREHPDACELREGWECYAGKDMTLDEARGYALAYINHARSDVNLAPLSLDFRLNDFAQMGSKELARDHRPHQHLEGDVASCPTCAEVQADPVGLAVAHVHDQLDGALAAMLSGGAGGTGGASRDVLLGGAWHRLGVGIVNPDGVMYFTVDVAP